MASPEEPQFPEDDIDGLDGFKSYFTGLLAVGADVVMFRYGKEWFQNDSELFANMGTIAVCLTLACGYYYRRSVQAVLRSGEKGPNN